MSGWTETQWEWEAMAESRAIPPPLDWSGSHSEKDLNPGPAMHVFVDDSGCPGFKFADGSSTHVVMAAAIFPDPLEIERLASAMDFCASKNRLTKEFKYSGLKERHRDCLFECTSGVRLILRAITADKRKVYSPLLREGPPLKSHLLRQLLTHHFGNISNAKVVVDGKDTRGLGIPDRDYIKRKVNKETPGTIHSVKFADSKQNRGIQIADMLAGAIGRSIQEGTKTPSSKHRLRISGCARGPLGDIWDFTAKS